MRRKRGKGERVQGEGEEEEASRCRDDYRKEETKEHDKHQKERRGGQGEYIGQRVEKGKRH